MWVNNADYGYVWVPNVGKDFSPYASNGYWVYTAEGWTWVSDYPWGWAPFHYGRWYYDQVYGSIWVPDNVWGPGWVDWRRSDGYYGWSPMRPSFGMGHNVRYGGWRFVRDRDFGRRDINNYYVSNHTTILKNSTVINNIHTDKVHNVSYNAGPERKEIETHQGKTITPVSIKENTMPGQHLNNNQLEIYKPKIEKDDPNKFKPAPTKVTDLKDVKRRDDEKPRNQSVQPATNLPSAHPVETIKQPSREIKSETQLPSQKVDRPVRQPIKQQPLKPQPLPPRNEQTRPVQPVRPQPVRPQPTQPSTPPLPPKSVPVRPVPQQRKEIPKANIPASPEQYKKPVTNRLPVREVPDPQPPGQGEQIHH